jgi:hypothetical protein
MKRANYTRSPWSGETYEHPPTEDELEAESTAVLQRHPLWKWRSGGEASNDWLERYAQRVADGSEQARLKALEQGL